MGPPNDLILYHYPFSPFAKRVEWYLLLRRIDFAQCLQPHALPRPDLEAIGVAYRRIPVLAHDRDVFCDTRLIINYLERAFPGSSLTASSAEHEGIRRLLESWTIDGGLFQRAGQSLSADLPLLKDPKFIQDRKQYSGRKWDRQTQEQLRPEALVHLHEAFSSLETGLLGDGRHWILGTDVPSLADIDAVWVFHWLIGLKGTLPGSSFSESTFPKVFAWVDRFDKVIKGAKKEHTGVTTIKGHDATSFILGRCASRNRTYDAGDVDMSDPTNLRFGSLVESWPTDTGSSHKDSGTLLKLDRKECVLENDRGILIHHPRWNFRVAESGGRASL